jgi:hypothetical protein
MAEAARQYLESPIAVRLRELQTLTEIAREKNLVVVTPTAVGSDLATVLGLMRTQSKESR